MREQELQLPVLVLLDKDGYLIAAGKPDCVKKKDIAECALEGGSIKTMTLKDFQAANYKWIYSKPATPTTPNSTQHP